jgi:hypothetical protein|tara:strand:- start:479 stop:1150 length:672 start_codon:yes stop_codon:yes gene_type:complete
MKISESTLEVLTNFSSINNGITVQVGSEIKTISPMKNIFGKATITDNFTQEFSVYDLPEFLATISLLGKDAEFSFNDNSVNISGDGASATYNYAESSMIIAPPEKDITMPNPEVVFDLDIKLLNKLKKASAVLSLPDMVLESDGKVVSLSVRDKKNPTTNQFSEVIMDGDGQSYAMNFKMENIKIVDDEYSVYVSAKGLAQFVAKNKGLEYFIALEPDSVFGS